MSKSPQRVRIAQCIAAGLLVMVWAATILPAVGPHPQRKAKQRVQRLRSFEAKNVLYQAIEVEWNVDSRRQE